MARPKSLNPPKYRRHRSTGRAVVTIDGRDIYLGVHGSPESRAEYDRIISEWLLAGRKLPDPEPSRPSSSELTVVELVDKFLDHAAVYYAGSREYLNLLDALIPVTKMFGRIGVSQFGPVALAEVRQAMVEGRHQFKDHPESDGRPKEPTPLARTTINARVNRIRRAFKWGVSRQLVPAAVLTALQSLEPLRFGRSLAKETDPVRPVSDDIVDATVAHLRQPISDMVRLQRITGMRSGELVIMRTIDIDRTGKVWTYRPARHKTLHRGHERIVWLGPQAQRILEPYLRTDLEAYLFSPADAAERQKQEKRASSKAPLTEEQRKRRRKKRPRKRPGQRYTVESYRRAIKYACDRAGLPRWHPHQLRHSAATRLRREFGLEAARTILGQKTLEATQIYAEQDAAKAQEVMSRVG